MYQRAEVFNLISLIWVLIAFNTFPDFIQVVQTFIRLTVPLICARTFWRLGSQRRRVLWCEWLTLFPTIGFIPQISHILAIILIP